MDGSNYLITALLLLATSGSTANYHGPFYFSQYEPTSSKYEITDFSVYTNYFPPEVEGVLINHVLWKSELNYHFLYSYTSQEKTYSFNPYKVPDEFEDIQSVKDLLRNKQICRMEDNSVNKQICWTSPKSIVESADLKPTLPRNLEVNPPPISPFFSSCKIEWGCSVEKVKLPIFVKPSSKGQTYYPFIKSPKGEKIKLNNTLNLISYNHSMLIVNPVLESTLASKPARCIVSLKSKEEENNQEAPLDKPICEIELDGENRTIEFKGNYAAYKNWVLMIETTRLKSHTVFKINDKLNDSLTKRIVQTRPKKRHNKRDAETTYDLTTALDLRELESQIVLLEHEMKYDLTRMQMENTELRNLITKIVKSISKIDDGILSELTGIPSHTEWIDHEHFLLRETTGATLSTIGSNSSNCKGIFKFSNGRWKIDTKRMSNFDCKKWENSIPFLLFSDKPTEEMEFKSVDTFHHSDSPYEEGNFLYEPTSVTDSISPSIGRGEGPSFLSYIESGLKGLFGVSSMALSLGIGLLLFIVIKLLCNP